MHILPLSFYVLAWLEGKIVKGGFKGVNLTYLGLFVKALWLLDDSEGSSTQTRVYAMRAWLCILK